MVQEIRWPDWPPSKGEQLTPGARPGRLDEKLLVRVTSSVADLIVSTGYMLHFGTEKIGEYYLRTVYSIDLKVDIPSGDNESAAAIEHLFKEAGETIHAQLTILNSKGKAPETIVRVADSQRGEVEVLKLPKK